MLNVQIVINMLYSGYHETVGKEDDSENQNTRKWEDDF